MNILSLILNYPLYIISFFIPKNSKIWVFGAWYGRSYSDNSKYLYEYVCNNYSDIDSYWITSDNSTYSHLKSNHKLVLKKNSIRSLLICLRSKVFIYTHSCMRDIYPFANHPYSRRIQLWHSLPLKKVVFDDDYRRKLPDLFYRIFPFMQIRESMMMATSVETKKIFSQAFKMNPDNVKITGFPRNDQLIKNEFPDSEKSILYAPTFRGSADSNFDQFTDYDFNVTKIDESLKQINMKLYIKLHPVSKIAKQLQAEIDDSANILFIEPSKDINEILNQFSMLITDYSGIYLDYLLLNRPIIFSAFDLSDYMKKSRQLYYNYDEVTPGPKAKNWPQIIEQINHFIMNPDFFSQERIGIMNLFHQYTDGNSSYRVMETIMESLNE